MMEWCLKKQMSLKIQRSIFYHQGGKLELWMMEGSTMQSKTLSYHIINGFQRKLLFLSGVRETCPGLLRFVEIFEALVSLNSQFYG